MNTNVIVNFHNMHVLQISDFIGWVPDVLRLLAVSRSGLTSNEILDILVTMGYQENVKVTQFDWLMFMLCIGENLTQSPSGILNFSHQHIREVVEYVLLRKFIVLLIPSNNLLTQGFFNLYIIGTGKWTHSQSNVIAIFPHFGKIFSHCQTSF